MRRILLKSKIHRGRVTEANLHYEGSVTIDAALMEAADIAPYEQVQIYDITRGSRLTTYAIPGPNGSGEICINGAAAHLVQPGDLVIICSYAEYEAAELKHHQPRIVHVDARNRVAERPEQPPATAPRTARPPEMHAQTRPCAPG
ncbi:MAG: aspartate 1-decarboxylase [Planctomycetota bacterium]|nr:MAG: aspartate 1-decarboxylase [Planctomycetota bacterium]